jgi:hypothetical protein
VLLVGFDTLIYRKYYDTPPILVGHQCDWRINVQASKLSWMNFPPFFRILLTFLLADNTTITYHLFLVLGLNPCAFTELLQLSRQKLTVRYKGFWHRV